MTRDETVALFLECEAIRAEARAAALAEDKSEDDAREIAHEAAKAHWNAWAESMLDKRKTLELSGQWYAEGCAWIEEAKTDFSNCSIPLARNPLQDAPRVDTSAGSLPIRSVASGTLDMRGFVFPAEASFVNSAFQREAKFNQANFKGCALFDSATFHQFTSFESVNFQAEAYFRKATVNGSGILFDLAAFQREASFENAIFENEVSFANTTFQDRTSFSRTVWNSFVTFGAIFRGTAWFYNAVFDSAVWFGNATFHKEALFGSVIFNGEGRFDRTIFQSDVSFDGAVFRTNARFEHAIFEWGADFESTIFEGNAWFGHAHFKGKALFRNQKFPGSVSFGKAKFGPWRADFGLSTFERVASFDAAEFMGEADFNAILGKRAFSMAGARFERVPDFVQAHFDEGPRLDNVYVAPTQGLDRLTEEEARNLFARWRALKRLAVQALDTDRELEFNGQEIRAERMASHWPKPPKLTLLDGRGWHEWLRSLSGWLYGLFSDYGRSLFRPLIWWFAAAGVAAAFYFSQAETIGTLLSARPPCFAPTAKPADSNETRIDGLSEKVRGETNARAEALHLAFRNAFIVLDGGSDAAHRTYGCLYGLEMYAGQNPVPIVPSAVSTVSAIQKLFSGLMIFLFGLALRNMLKVK